MFKNMKLTNTQYEIGQNVDSKPYKKKKMKISK